MKHKFRGKRIDNGEWVYGSLITMNDGSWIIPQSYDCVAISSNYVKLPGPGRYAIYGMIEVHPDSVGMLTGLVDKKGVGIYEGDIIQQGIEGAICGWFCPRVVEFKNGAWMGHGTRIYVEQDKADYEGKVSNNEWEVIGNTTDDKHLLEK